MNLWPYLRAFSIIHAAKLTQENVFSLKPYISLLFNLPKAFGEGEFSFYNWLLSISGNGI